MTPCQTLEPCPTLPQPSAASGRRVSVKNTFIEMAASPCKRSLRRSLSDSAMLSRRFSEQLLIGSPDEDVFSLAEDSSCHRSRENIAAMREHETVDIVGQTHEPSIMNLDACVEHSTSHRVKPQILSLTACLEYSWSQEKEVMADVSDTSTDTPRGSIEDISIHDCLEASLIADILPEEDIAEFPGSLLPSPEVFAKPEIDSFHSDRLWNARASAMPYSTDSSANREAWLSPWQWTAPVDVRALQLPIAGKAQSS